MSRRHKAPDILPCVTLTTRQLTQLCWSSGSELAYSQSARPGAYEKMPLVNGRQTGGCTKRKYLPKSSWHTGQLHWYWHWPEAFPPHQNHQLFFYWALCWPDRLPAANTSPQTVQGPSEEDVVDFGRQISRTVSLKALIATAPEQMHKTCAASDVNQMCLHFLKLWDSADRSLQNEALVWLRDEQDILWLSQASSDTSRMIQRCIADAYNDMRLDIVEPLKGHVGVMIKSPHANYVLTECIKTLPPHMIRFIVDEIKPDLVKIACQRFGCRVVEKLVDYVPATSEIFLEIATVVAENAIVLADAPYGNYCLQSLLEAIRQSSSRDAILLDIRKTVFDSFMKSPEKLHLLAGKPGGSRVVQSLLQMATTVEALKFFECIAPNPPAVLKLALGKTGSCVLEQMLASRGGVGGAGTSDGILCMQTKVLEALLLRSSIEELTKTKHGTGFLKAVGKIFFPVANHP